jgi:MFS family permease
LPHVLRWLIGLTTSLIGTHIYLVTLAWVAVQTTTPANVGLILVAGAIPQAAMLLIGGVFVDRIGPKRTIISSDVLRTLIMVVFAIVVARGAVSPWLLALLAVLFGLVDGFFLPAVSAAPRYLVPHNSITRVVAAAQIVSRGAEFAGAPLGSWILLVASAAVAFSVNATLFAVSVAMLAITRMAIPQHTRVEAGLPKAGLAGAGLPKAGLAGAGLAGAGPAGAELRSQQTRPSVWTELAQGIRLIRAYPTLRTLLIVVFVVELGFGGPMMVGVPLLAHETGWGVRTIGWVLGGFGLGAAAAAGFLAWRKNLRRTGLAALTGLAAIGISITSLGMLPAYALPPSAAFAVAGFLGLTAGIGVGFYGTLVTSTVLQVAPAGQIGRVMGALTFSNRAAVPVTFALTGLATGLYSAQVPFLVGGLLVLLAATVAFANPQVRRLSIDVPDRAAQDATQHLSASAERVSR